MEQAGKRTSSGADLGRYVAGGQRRAGDALDSLISGLGMPRGLGAVKIGRDNFQRIAVQAMATPWVPRNPRPVEGPDQVRKILELAS